jgi:hypothetical protein
MDVACQTPSPGDAVKKLGPFLFNPRSEKVHLSGCHFVRRTVFPLEPIAIEATTTDEARERIEERGFRPCDYCLPWDEGLGHGRRFGEPTAQRYMVRDGRSESEETEEPWQIVDTETNERGGGRVEAWCHAHGAGVEPRRGEWYLGVGRVPPDDEIWIFGPDVGCRREADGPDRDDRAR